MRNPQGSAPLGITPDLNAVFYEIDSGNAAKGYTKKLADVHKLLRDGAIKTSGASLAHAQLYTLG